MTVNAQAGEHVALELSVTGLVQGVGFRPTVYRVAKEMGLRGHVKNTGSDVEICLDGREKEFMEELKNTLPPLARIDGYDVLDETIGAEDFQIIPSGGTAIPATLIPTAMAW